MSVAGEFKKGRDPGHVKHGLSSERVFLIGIAERKNSDHEAESSVFEPGCDIGDIEVNGRITCIQYIEVK
jgi:hypothetical protein